MPATLEPHTTSIISSLGPAERHRLLPPCLVPRPLGLVPNSTSSPAMSYLEQCKRLSRLKGLEILVGFQEGCWAWVRS